MGVRYKLEGDIPEAPVLYVSNHRGFIDPVIIASHVDACVIAKAEVADLPLISKGATMTGIIYVKRDSKDSRSATRVAMVSQLDQGQNVLVFPEGTTNKEKHVISYKVGTFIEAAKKNIPVVPIVLEYKDEKDLWYKRSLLGQHFRQFGHLFTHARMKIGKPITHEDGIAIAKEVEAWTNHHIDQIHTEWDSHFSKIASI